MRPWLPKCAWSRFADIYVYSILEVRGRASRGPHFFLNPGAVNLEFTEGPSIRCRSQHCDHKLMFLVHGVSMQLIDPGSQKGGILDVSTCTHRAQPE